MLPKGESRGHALVYWKDSPGRMCGCLPTTPGAVDLGDGSFCICDLPVSCDEAGRFGAVVFDFNLVDKIPEAFVWCGVLG